MSELRRRRLGFVIVTESTMVDRMDAQRLQLEDNVTIMKLARINDEKENETSHIVFCGVKSPGPLTSEIERMNKLRSKFVEK